KPGFVQLGEPAGDLRRPSTHEEPMNSLVRRHGSEAGIALPITLILMALITSLTVAFLAFTSAEPLIATHQMANSHARAIAESGIERAPWALSGGETIPNPAWALADPP